MKHGPWQPDGYLPAIPGHCCPVSFSKGGGVFKRYLANIMVCELEAVIDPPHYLPRSAVCGGAFKLLRRVSEIEPYRQAVHVIGLRHMMQRRVIFKRESEQEFGPVPRDGAVGKCRFTGISEVGVKSYHEFIGW